jgi:deoxyribose-phosphate aldolase
MKKVNSYSDFINEAQAQNQAIQLSKFAKMIDFSYIREDATKDNLNEIMEIAKANHFYGIVVNPEFTDYVAYDLDGTNIKVITTLDFPDGDSKDVDKVSMAIEAISDGTDEIDMVMWWQGIKDAYAEEDEENKKSLLDAVEKDIRGIANECHKNAIILKVIIESGMLTLEELVIACQIAAKAGADYVQTSTGTKGVGAEFQKIKEMRRILPDYVKIKVAGGIRTLEQCNMYYPYVDRIGTSVIPK